jgi:superfamily II DNA or RNA helicase
MVKLKQPTSYFQEHRKLLQRVVDDYKANSATINLFATNDYAIFNNINTGVTKHPLRKYQMEALYILDYLLRCNDNKQEKKHLLEEIDKDTKAKAPFLSYEMATGSGKTMLMGASTYFLNQKFNIKNFLIITPASTDIYQKTIRNFTVGGYDSVWADDTPFRFNLITGDNYTQNLFFDASKDANIFIFNISKFGTNATNTGKTWESAVWQDKEGNSISIKDFLKGEKLVIITDEAHHHQTPAAKKIINNFHPTVVLEFTATAVEAERGQEKKNQQIVYKYDIRRFLEDGHGKLVRAVALANETKKTKDAILQSEKLKLVTLFFIHLLKKKAVLLDPKCKGLKPIAFVKVKEDTLYTQKVFDYICNDLANDLDNINIILDKVKTQDLEITQLLTDLYLDTYQSNIELLRSDIHSAAKNTIFYYGNSDKETEKKFHNIRKNEVEIVVYMQRLDEGIDLPNIYTMAVINDSESNFKTSVKQIIGRGIRLNKDTREFDEETNLLIQQAEKLHIVCDQGKNFEEVITAIQQEFGLNNKYLSFDKPKLPIINRAKSELLKGKYLPHIKADFKAKEGVNLINLINDYETIVAKYTEDNCFAGPEDEIKRFIKYRPDSFFLEVDIFANKKEYHKQLQQTGGIETKLSISEKEIKTIYGHVQKNLHCLPDTDTVRKAFKTYIDMFNEKQLKYYRLDDADDKLALNLFVNSFSFYYRNHIEKNYFILDFRQINEGDSWNLMKRFENYELRIPDDQIANKKRLQVRDRTKLIELIESNYHFFGYEKSVYDYENFDSYTEMQLAEYANEILKKEGQHNLIESSVEERELETLAAEAEVPYGRNNKNFWIRNQRNIYFTYGSKKYYPDFIVYNNGFIYVIETKGEIFSDTKKNTLLKKLDEIPGDGKIKGFKGLLIFSAQLDEMGDNILEFDEFVKKSEEILRRHQTKTDLIQDPPLSQRFKKFIPVYTALKAYKNFIKKQKTAKPEGWLEVKENPEGYPLDLFATQAKGNALNPIYEHNDWICFLYTPNVSDSLNKLALVFCDKITDEYDRGCTLRIVEIHETKSKTSLFGNKEIHLKPYNTMQEPIVIQDVNTLNPVDVVAVEYGILR